MNDILQSVWEIEHLLPMEFSPEDQKDVISLFQKVHDGTGSHLEHLEEDHPLRV